MQHRMTITLDTEVYKGLQRYVAPRKRSQFIENAIRPLLNQSEADLEAGYAAMAADEQREREAHEWTEGLIGDSLGGDSDETW